MQEGTEIHTAMGLRGAIYKYSVDSLNLKKDGGQETLLDSAQMTDPNVNIVYFKGIAMPATTEGAYAALYIVNQDNLSIYRSRWGADLDGIPGSLNFGMINGAWSLPSNADICEVSKTDTTYTYSIWTTSGTAVSRYPSCIWSNTADKTFDLGIALNGVALGNANDLWVLTADRRIFQISSENGTILNQFALSSDISQPSGIEFDGVAGSLWIGNRADNSIYQVAISVKSKIPGDANGDGAVDVGDLAFSLPIMAERIRPGSRAISTAIKSWMSATWVSLLPTMERMPAMQIGQPITPRSSARVLRIRKMFRRPAVRFAVAWACR
jgi:hypothetical protein